MFDQLTVNVAAAINDALEAQACRDLRWRIWPHARRNLAHYRALAGIEHDPSWYKALSWAAFVAVYGVWQPPTSTAWACDD